MAVNCSPFGPRPQFELANGQPAVGALMFFYVAGSVNTKQNTYTDSTGLVANPNPIILNSFGMPANEIWFTAGQAYKVYFAVPGDTDPPTSPLYPPDDNLRGINDTSVAIDQWISSGVTPTFVSAVSFTVPGDQTSAFHIGRRLKFTESAGTVYGTISASVFGALTTVTVVTDPAQVLDSGLSAVQLALLTAVNPSVPQIVSAGPGITVNYTGGKPSISTTGFYASDINDFRLTLTTGVPVTTTNVTGATTVFCCPYKGNRISLYDGTNWNVRTTAQFSLALGTLTTTLPYDVFCYDNAGTPTLEFLVWTNTTTRATALVYQDGILSKSGAVTRRYLGTFFTSAATTTEDSLTQRYLWNYYNRTIRQLQNTFTADRSQTSVTYVEVNSEIRCQFVLGVSEDASQWMFSGSAVDSVVSTVAASALAFDSTTVQESPMQNLFRDQTNTVDANFGFAGAKFNLAVGFHYATVLCKSDSGSLTFRSADAATTAKCYLTGNILG